MWEKAGVNISVVYGSMPPEAYRAATGVKSEVKKAVRAERIPPDAHPLHALLAGPPAKPLRGTIQW